MKSNLFIIVVLFMLAVLPYTIAHDGPHEQDEFNYETVDEFIWELPSIDAELESRNFDLPKSVAFLLGEGNMSVTIDMDDKSTREFYFTIEGGKMAGISTGAPEEFSYSLVSDEDTSMKIFASDNKTELILSSYDEGDISVDANGFGNNVKLFFAKIFINFI